MKIRLTPLAAALMMCCTVAVAENVSHSVTETVVVTASGTGQDLLDVNNSVSLVSPDSLVNSSVNNVPDMLRREAGVSVMNDGTPGVKRISLRSEGAARTLVTVDGLRIDDQKNKSGVPFLINPYFIDRIEVVRGPASVLYGSDALGGIVNVISKRPVGDDPFAIEGGVSFTSAAEGFTEHATVSGNNGKMYYALGGFRTDQGDIYLSDRDRLENTEFSAQGINGVIGINVSDNLSLEYALDYYDLDAETATTVDNPIYSQYRGDMPEWSRIRHAFSAEMTDINEYIAALSAKVYIQSNDKTFYSWPQPGMNVSVVNEQETIGGNLKGEFSFGDTFYLVTGVDLRREKLDSYGSMSFRMGSAGGAFDTKDSDYEQNSNAVYALLSTYLTPELTLNTGVRYNHIETVAGSSSMTGMMSLPGGTNIPVNEKSSGGDSVNVKTIGSAGLVYRPFDYGAFRLNWAQGFRAPNIQELFLITSTGAVQYGNPNLKPEETDTYEAGFRWEDPNGLNADIAVFFTKADNYIENAAVPGTSFFTYQNIAEAETLGAELSISYLAGNFEPYLTLTRTEREYKTASGSSKNTGTPDFSGNAGLKYYGSLINADAWVKFATDTVNDNLDGSSYMGSSRWGGYAVYNLSVSADFGENDNITVFSSVENIFDKSYQTNELIREPGRFFTLGIKGRF